MNGEDETITDLQSEGDWQLEPADAAAESLTKAIETLRESANKLSTNGRIDDKVLDAAEQIAEDAAELDAQISRAADQGAQGA